MARKIIDLSNPILRSPSLPLTFPLSEEILEDIQGLKRIFREGLKQMPVMGLSAPQIGVSKRFFLIPTNLQFNQYSPRVMHLAIKKFDVYINPSIISYSQKTIWVDQRCLSVPGKRYDIERPESVKVRYYTTIGKEVTKNLIGIRSRIFQHELDHLDGITIDIKKNAIELKQQTMDE